jgi:PAS domain S-box-containing protein
MVPNLVDDNAANNHELIKCLTENASNFAIFHLIYHENRPNPFEVKSVSDNIEDILGIKEYRKFEKWLENVHSDDRKRIDSAFLEAFKGGRFDQEFRFRHPAKKQVRWLRGFSITKGSENKNKMPLQFVGLLFDITHRKNLELSFVGINESFQNIFETVPAIIFQLDREGRITYISSFVEKVFQYTQRETVGRKIHEYIAQDTKHTMKAFEILLAGKPLDRLEVSIQCKDGHFLPCEVKASPLKAGDEVIGIQGIIRDMGEQKRAEAKLRRYLESLEIELSLQHRQVIESEARYRGIVEDSLYMVCRFLEDGTVTFANQMCEKTFGENEKKLEQQNFFEWVAEEEDVEGVKKKFEHSFLLKSPPFIECQHRFEGEFRKWIRWTGQGLHNADGYLLEYQAMGRDVTEEKNREIERSKAEQFQRRAQKLEALGTLSAGIAHDFNNILAVLLGNVQLITDDVPVGSRPRKNVDEMVKAILRARDMIKQILTFCREGEQALSPISITSVVKESIKFLRSSIPSTVEIFEDIAQTDVVIADPAQISQVVLNLGSNAAQAIGSDLGTIEITLKNTEIDADHEERFRVLSEGRYVEMIFRDSGSGISSEDLSRIFDPYFTTKAEGEGSGMGLAVVHGIVDGHGGTIWAISSPGEGTVFHILFPVTDSEIEIDSEPSGDLIGGHERILLVDDRENLLSAEREILERLGYQVTAVMDPIEALEIFRSQPHRYDLVYTDMTMPHMNGLTLSRKLLEIRPEIPIILYTGLGDLMDADEIEMSGIRAFLKKPILVEELAQTIRRVLTNESKRSS